jgi:uncharacterized protein (TIGR02001 family)
MKNITMFIIGLICMGNCALAQYAEPTKDANLSEKAKLGIQLDVTWVSKYIWHGQDLYEGHAAFQPSITFDLYGSGFSVGVWGSSACGGGFVNSDELDYWAAYSNSLFKDTKFKTDFEVKWTYYDYTRISSDEADSEELDFSFSWPNIFPCGIVPNYTLSYLYSATSHSPAAALEMDGFMHTFGFTYDVNVPQVKLPLPLKFSWDITYNDGQGGKDFGHEWAYTTFGLSSYIKCGPGGFTPAIYFQKTMDKSTNPQDEIWCSFSYTLNF